MSIPTNLYSDKILSEHPLAMWSLDDNSDYVSLISEPFRNLDAWTATNATSLENIEENTQTKKTAPFPLSYVTKVVGSSTPGTTTLTSNLTFSSDADGFTVGFYIQTTTDVTVRVKFTGGLNQQVVVLGTKYPTLTWIPVSFTVPTQASNKTLEISFVYTTSSPEFLINGLTIGKNSEPFNGESFGQSLITLPSTISTTQTKGIEAKSYGNQTNPGYYIGSGNDLYAKNAGMSMSYGSANSAIIYPHATEGQPSFIFPGFGFLNESGRYKQLTLEMLVRINANTSSPKRIIGPLASDDGVYVTNEFISLKIGDEIGSFYLSELYRPMLLQVQIAENFAVLSVDGDDLISLPIQTSTLILPELLDSSIDKKNQDWIGLFAYSDVPFIEVDSIAIYPYKTTGVLSKMRLAYAQAVDVPLDTNIKFGGSSVLLDYGFSNYTNNYNYPSFQAKWEQASIIENFDVSNTQTLSTRTYAAPQIQSSLYTPSLLLKDLYHTNVEAEDNDTFITLRPVAPSGSGREWTTNQGYIYASSFNKNEHLSTCIYGIFKSLESSGTEQVLVQITNESNDDYLKISLTNTTVSYKLRYEGTVSTIKTKSITQNERFAVGIDIKTFSSANPNVAAFLSNINSLNIYVGGQNTTANTFSGNIYKVGLCSPRNFLGIADLFVDGVVDDVDSHSDLMPKTATYTILGVQSYERILLDIATSSYWQDYIPLSKLTRTIDIAPPPTLQDPEPVQQLIEELDFLQLNIDYPETKIIDTESFDTTSSRLKSYITFQRLDSGAAKTSSEFETTILASENRLIDASTPVEASKYEFVNGMVVYPPRPEITELDWDKWAIVFHIELENHSSNLTPYQIRYLQVGAKTLEVDDPNSIGTRHGTNLYPYIYSNNAYNYKEKNPHIVFKQATPYLYLTRHSGLRVCGELDLNVDRGAYFEIGNDTLDISINAIQMSILADLNEFPLPETPIKIFELESKNEKISFLLKRHNAENTKGIIYTESANNPPIYYLNGKIVASPVIELGEWNVLGISFLDSVDLSESVGKIKITSNILLNNISVYGLDLENNAQDITNLTWDVVDNENWNQLGTWRYSSVADYYKVYDNGMKEIYQTYTGTNKISVDTSSNDRSFQFKNYQYIGYMDIEKNIINIDIR
jgi:hypothetical protein